MDFQIPSLIVYILATAIILLIIFIKISPKKKKEQQNQEILEILEIQHKEAKLELNELLLKLKQSIEKRYNISKKLSLNEIIIELEKQQEKDFSHLCKKIQKYYYTNKELTETEVKNIKEILIETIKKIDRKHEKKERIKKQQQTILDHILSKEQELKDKIRVQKITHSRLKNKNSKVVQSPSNKE